jgi:glycosyltransferase involved in cell wall biosynthesis
MTYSILIANYNNNKYLNQCIDSALNQNGKENFSIEIIVCDDCSGDNSFEIISSYSNKEITFVRNLEKRGVGFTKKKLIDSSSGDYFLFLDSDDFLDPDAVLSIHSYLQNVNIKPAIIYTDSRSVDTNGNVISKKGRSKKVNNDLLKESFTYPIFHLVVYDKEAYNQTEGANSMLRAAFDFDLWYKFDEVGKISYLDKVVYNYRLNSYGISQVKDDNKKKISVMLWHYITMYEACKRREIDFDEYNLLFSKIISTIIFNDQDKYRNIFLDLNKLFVVSRKKFGELFSKLRCGGGL